jgi:hypothetical protein
MPPPRQQVRALLVAAEATATPRDRIGLLQAARAVLDAAVAPASDEDADIRRTIDVKLRADRAVDQQYAQLVDRVIAEAHRAAAAASVSAVERLFDEVEKEDARLGDTRPAMIQSLRAALDARLQDARDLHIRRSEWIERRDVYRDYVARATAEIVQLVQSQETLDAIRRMAGLSPRRVRILQKRLDGGADRLQTMAAPDQLRETQDLLVAAWRFAESAAESRRQAVVTGRDALVEQASSAAAGALLLLARAQAEMRSALELPQLR